MKRNRYKSDRKFKNDRNCSLDDVAKELGVSIERARVIEQTALRKCKDWCDANGFDLEQMLTALGKSKDMEYTLVLEDAEFAD